MQTLKGVLFVVALIPLVPSLAWAQATLAGVVKDTSGAVLPGVSVEAASPVLIEKVRTAVTDSNGQYQIVNLLPGTYSLTFSLSGFRGVKREGVAVTGSGVITISADMQVGDLAETITVSGESPIVDIQSTRRQTVLDSDTVNAIPAARGFGNILASLPGLQITMTNPASPFNPWYTAHGGRGNEGKVQIGGLNAGGAVGGGGTTGFAYDIANTQEVQVTVSGGLGESDTGGPVMNIIPKEGGNNFSGSLFGSIAGEWSQGQNLDDELRAFGITSPAALITNYDYSGALGGPLKRDRLWFFATTRTYGNQSEVPGLYGNLNAGDASKWTYQRDPSLQVRGASGKKIVATRVTAQLTPRNKVGFYHDYNLACNGSSLSRDGDQCRKRGDDWVALGALGGFAPGAPESQSLWDDREKIIQGTWTSTATNKLLLEAGYSTFVSLFGGQDPAGSRPDLIAVTEQFAAPPGSNGPPVGNFTYRGLDTRTLIEQQPHSWRAAASYVTGSHNLKFGLQGAYNTSKTTAIVGDSQLAYRFGNGVPNQFTMRLGPREQSNRSTFHGLYVQDSWTFNRLTLQGALRYEHATSFFPEEGNGIAVATRFSAAPISFGRLDGVTGYNDITPRMGMVWDVLGNGKTALKVNLGKYLEPVTNDGNYTIGNKAGQLQVSTTRNWTDANGNYVPDCELMNPLTQDLRGSGGDFCGPWGNSNFGNTVNPLTVNPDVLHGWNIRPYDWQFGASIQQELLPRLSAEVAYNRRWFDNFFVTDNLAVTAANYDTLNYTVPQDARLPDGGGYQTSFLMIQPAVFGLTNNYYTFESDYGDATRYWHGVDVDLKARLQNGLVLQGGWSSGRGVRDTCDITADLPELLLLVTTSQQISSCDVREKWLTTVRGIATYTVPKVDVLVSAILRSEVNAAVAASGTTVATNGASLAANFNMPNATFQQLLGRPIAGGALNTNVNLLRPGEFYSDKRLNNVDVRFAKVLRFGGTRTNVGIDLYNLFNANTPTSYDQVYGANWLRPTGVKIPRFLRFNATFDF
jgi:hypothetical protein